MTSRHIESINGIAQVSRLMLLLRKIFSKKPKLAPAVERRELIKGYADAGRLMFQRWYGPLSRAIKHKYPHMGFSFQAPGRHLEAECLGKYEESPGYFSPVKRYRPNSYHDSDLRDRSFGDKGCGWYYSPEADFRIFHDFAREACLTFIGYRPDFEPEQRAWTKQQYLLHRNRETNPDVDRKSVFDRWGGHCGRCRLRLDFRFFQVHEIYQDNPGTQNYVALCGDCHSCMGVHSSNPVGSMRYRPLYRTINGNLHREGYSHTKKLKNITQVWPELGRRWESEEDERMYSERELAWFREINVGHLCRICYKPLDRFWPDPRLEFRRWLSQMAGSFSGIDSTFFNQIPLDREEVLPCGGVSHAFGNRKPGSMSIGACRG